MKRKLIIAALALVIVIAGVSVYLYNSIDSIVKNAIEHFGTEICGTSVSVGSVDISLKSGRGTLRNVHVRNPDGFSGGNAMELGEVTVEISVGSLNRDPIIIQEIRVLAPVVNAEINDKLATNLGVIRDHVGNYQAAAAKPAGKQDSGFEKHFVIRSFVMEEGKIEGDATSVGGKKGEFALPPVELSNVGGTRGSRPEALGKVLCAAMFARAEKAAADELKAGAVHKLEGKLGDIIGK
ncbi:MAG TPA: hypothetical protein VFH88_01290 [Candidatus Krumholzibacteria bacterium]|nr:hypothetical protein [Candidatus Krumholzibacteria bacterium]